MNGEGFRMHLATLRIDIDVKGATGGKLVFQFQTTNFNDPVTLIIKPGRFRIKNDLTHDCPSAPCSVPAMYQ